jgi:hypothetical protein
VYCFMVEITDDIYGDDAFNTCIFGGTR